MLIVAYATPLSQASLKSFISPGLDIAHPPDLESGKLLILAILQGKNACKGLPKIAPLFDIGEHCLSHWR